jgi:surfeit locus 1 family protein
MLTLFSAVALALLVLLGAWQWRRYEDKRLVQGLAASTVSLEPFLPIPEGRQLVFGARDGRPGWRVFEPVRYGDRVVFVDAGYVAGAAAPDWRVVPASKALAAARAVSGEVVHPRGPGAFAARADPARRLWYGVDLPAMAAAAGLHDVEPWYVAMAYIGPTGAAEPNPFARPAAEPLPPERHLGYAITWWGLAAALVAVYLAFHARQGRLKITR